jgi:ABC-2 type transport system ATP-binding protein
MSRKGTMRPREKKPQKQIQNAVLMSAVSSMECVVWEGKTPQRVLSSIDLGIGCGEAWGITARTGYEILLLLQIMGNIRSYDSGKCVLAERGMMRQKRVIQPHVFYIEDADMLYGNMNTLEYLMFATAHLREDRLLMQEELFEYLIGCNLGYISLTAIKWLTAEEKAVVSLLAAAYSDSVMVIFNLPGAKFDERLAGAIVKTAALIIQRGKALMIGTMDCTLIDKACSHTAFIADGRIIYQGTVAYLRQTFDKVAVVIEDPDIGDIKYRLAPVLPGCVLAEKNGSLHIKADGEASLQIYRIMLEAGIVPRCMRVNEKTVSNAYEEIIQLYDLSEQLF